MGKVYGNVVLVTGASSGIGKSIAEYLAKEGYRVYGTSRNRQLENDGVSFYRGGKGGGFLKIINLDVCSEESIKKAVDYIVAKEGAINILINNAGFGIAGAVEDTSPGEAYKQFDTNFFGVHRMCRSVLPIMRRQKKGLIVNIGSVAGLVSIPFQSMYSASKYAIEALTEALRIEVKPFGIRVVVVEPGDTKTGFTGNRQFVKGSGDSSAYKGRFEKSIGTMVKSEMNGTDPEAIAKAVTRLTYRKRPPVRVVVGFSYKLIALLKRILPSRLVEFAVSKIYS